MILKDIFSVGAARDPHRVADGAENDWGGVDPASWNIWQKIADSTNGVITPANAADAISMVGEIGAARSQIYGAALREFAATNEVTGLRYPLHNAVAARVLEISRTAGNNPDVINQEVFLDGTKVEIVATALSDVLSMVDPLDGPLATATGTRSRLGEKVDADHDVMALVTKLYARLAIRELKPWEVATLLGAKGLTVGVTALGALSNREVHSSSHGKSAEAATMVALALKDLAHIADLAGQYRDVEEGALTPKMAWQGKRVNHQIARETSDRLATGALVGSSAYRVAAAAMNFRTLLKTGAIK